MQDLHYFLVKSDFRFGKDAVYVSWLFGVFSESKFFTSNFLGGVRKSGIRHMVLFSPSPADNHAHKSCLEMQSNHKKFNLLCRIFEIDNGYFASLDFALIGKNIPCLMLARLGVDYVISDTDILYSGGGKHCTISTGCTAHL